MPGSYVCQPDIDASVQDSCNALDTGFLRRYTLKLLTSPPAYPWNFSRSFASASMVHDQHQVWATLTRTSTIIPWNLP